MNIKNIKIENSILRKTLGVIFIIYGFLALITPFTPGSWLIFVGLGFLGFEFIFENRKVSLKKKVYKKNMKIFIAIKYHGDSKNKQLINDIKNAVKEAGHTPYCFLDEAHIEGSREMMKQAFIKLNECNVLFIEGSECSFGAGAEAGFAKAKNKKIIIAGKEGSGVSKTLEGMSDYYLIYKNIKDLQEKLKLTLTKLN